MTKIKHLLSTFAVLLLIFLTSCSKDSATDPATTPPAASSGDYYPTAINNTCTNKQNGTVLAPSKIIGTEVFNNSTYFKFNPTVASGVTLTQYLRKDTGVYYLKTSDATINLQSLTGTQTGFEIIFLKDNVPVDTTWSGTYSTTTTYSGFNPIVTTVNYTSKIIAKDVTAVVGTTTYDNVIKVFSTTTGTSQSNISVATSEYWLAKNVGVIKSIQTSGTSSTITELVSYTLF